MLFLIKKQTKHCIFLIFRVEIRAQLFSIYIQFLRKIVKNVFFTDLFFDKCKTKNHTPIDKP